MDYRTVGRSGAKISPLCLGTAILWVKDQPGISASLIGPRALEQLEHLLPVLDMKLTETIRTACDELVPPGSAVANFHNSSGWMKMSLIE
jgi:1-deoxyxylulose-5-phosphate synthase